MILYALFMTPEYPYLHYIDEWLPILVNCSAFLAFFWLFLLFPGPMKTSFFKVDAELFLLIAFRAFYAFLGLHKPKKVKCHTSDG